MLWFALAIGLIALVVLLLDLYIRVPSMKPIVDIFESVPPFKITPGQRDESAEEVAFPAADGLTLRGALYLPATPPRALIVFCPELNGNHWMAPEYCEGLLEADFAVLAFDFRNQGESDGRDDYDPLHWVTQYEVEDVHAALEYVQTREDLRDLPLGIMGISRGGGSALAAAAHRPEIQAVVVDSVFSPDTMFGLYVRHWGEIYAPRWYVRNAPDWHLNSMTTMAKWISQRRKNCRYVNLERSLPRLGNRSVLMIAGKRDSYVKPQVAHQLAEHIGPACDVWIVAKAKHNMARQINAEEYDRRVSAFFEHHLDLREHEELTPTAS